MIQWVTLTVAEQRLARYLAQQRTAVNRAAGVRNARVAPMSDDDADVLGMGGEIAFAKLFNVYPDMSTEPRRGGVDCYVGPFGVDVKTTRLASGMLLALPAKTVLATDVFALMIAQSPRFGFCGFARRGDLLHPSRLIDLGHGPTYALDQAELTPTITPWGSK